MTVRYFFIVPPGVVASPFFSAGPATGAPWVLASFADGMEVPVVGAPSFMAAPPPPAVVLPSMEPPVVVLLAAGPPALELPPAVLLVCASANVLESANAVAIAIVLMFMVVSSWVAPWGNNRAKPLSFRITGVTNVAENGLAF